MTAAEPSPEEEARWRAYAHEMRAQPEGEKMLRLFALVDAVRRDRNAWRAQSDRQVADIAAFIGQIDAARAETEAVRRERDEAHAKGVALGRLTAVQERDALRAQERGAEAAGRRKGLEEAARVAKRVRGGGEADNHHDVGWQAGCDATEAAILALIPEQKETSNG